MMISKSMEPKFTPFEYEMVLWSFDYIRNNRQITADQLPTILVKFWSIPGFINHLKYKPGCVQVFIFMFILRLNQERDELPVDLIHTIYFNQLFYNFQIILATVDYCRNHNILVTPFPLFDIHKYGCSNINDEEQLLKEYEFITSRVK